MSTTLQRTRGRPRDPNTRRRIIDAARIHFVQNGFEGTAVERIAESAGTTKVTLYTYFASKEELFNAVANEDRAALLDLSTDALPVSDPYDALLQVATKYSSLISDSTVINHMRFISGNVVRNSELGPSFYETGPRKVKDAISRYLARLDHAGALSIPNTQDAAEQFLGLLKGNEYMRLVLGLPASSPDQRQRYIESCVRMFVTAYSKNPSARRREPKSAGNR